MWICKECGGKITASVSGTIKGGWGYPDKDGDVTSLVNYSLDYQADDFTRDDCGKHSKNLEEIAVWED
jgi:hypothetical protein